MAVAVAAMVDGADTVDMAGSTAEEGGAVVLEAGRVAGGSMAGKVVRKVVGGLAVTGVERAAEGDTEATETAVQGVAEVMAEDVAVEPTARAATAAGTTAGG